MQYGFTGFLGGFVPKLFPRFRYVLAREHGIAEPFSYVWFPRVPADANWTRVVLDFPVPAGADQTRLRSRNYLLLQ